MTFIDFDKTTDTWFLLPLFWRYWSEVNGTNNLKISTFVVNGKTEYALQIEADLYQFLADGCRIKMVMDDGALCGFMIYRLMFDCILEVRAQYLLPEYRGVGLAKVMVDSCGDKIKRVIFQTWKHLVPKELMGVTNGKRRVIDEMERVNTWEMEWSNGS